MAHSNSFVKRNVEHEYCGKPVDIAKDCYKIKNHESNTKYKGIMEIMCIKKL